MLLVKMWQCHSHISAFYTSYCIIVSFPFNPGDLMFVASAIQLPSITQFRASVQKLLQPVAFMAFGIGLVMGTTQIVHAQTEQYNPAKHFEFYVTSPNYLLHIGKLTVDAEMALATGCRESLAQERADLQVQITPEFDPKAGHPSVGQWQDQISVDRCGVATQQNFLVAATNGDLPNFLVLLPGATRAPALVQGQSLPVAIDSLRAVCATADTYQVHNTEFVSEDSPVSLNEGGQIVAGQWTEMWQFYTCDQIFNVTMTFTALGDGNIQAQASL